MDKKTKFPYRWYEQEWAEDCEKIECPPYDPYKDFRRDPAGYYVLVRIEWDMPMLAVAVCNKDHKIVKVFKGRRAQDVYGAIFHYEKQHKLEWFREKTHVAYLGKELKKAEIAMAMGVKGYFQE